MQTEQKDSPSLQQYGLPVSADGGRTWSFIAADSAAMQTTYLIEMTEVLEGVTLDNTSLTLEKGTGHTLHAACSPAEITGTAFTWTSSVPQVASVSPEGTVSAVNICDYCELYGTDCFL